MTRCNLIGMLYTSRWHIHYLNILVIDLVFYLDTEYEFLPLQEGIKTVAILACLWRSSRWRWGLRGPGLWRRTAGTGALSSRLFGDIRIWAVVFFSVLVVWWRGGGARYQIWSRRKNIEKFVSPPVVLTDWLTPYLRLTEWFPWSGWEWSLWQESDLGIPH